MMNEEEIKSNPEKDAKKIMIVIGALMLIFIAILLMRLMIKPADTTLEGMITETLEGETSETNFIYNGYAFVNKDGLWYTQWKRDNNLYNLALHFSPKEAEEVIIEGNIDERFHKDKTYITFNPKGNYLQYIALSATELSFSMTKVFSVRPIAACSKNETSACIGRHIVDCSTNASVIYLKEGPLPKIIGKGNCIIIEGPGKDIVKATNRLIYEWYRIM